MKNDNDREVPGNAVHAVMEEIHRDFLHFLTRRLGDKDEAADVLHDFYVKVLTRSGDVRETEKLRAWMRRVLETSLIDYYRAQSKKRQSEQAHHDLEAALLDDDFKNELDFIVCTCLYKLLPTLKPEYAEILWHAELIGESRETIAAVLNISASNLRVRLHRAREALRKRLEETCGSCPIHGYLDCGCDSGAAQSSYGGAAG
ncbi:RNA polymerase sigma factor [Marinobacter manganoxydans]|uniref:ECF subfamily RNA polymerase sigma-24 factor n=1 Tax=Marinobacter manganoxydans MnI7-9 TaxID=1094979 RepID=G6YNS1_9GAMM|nr:sigma-70 family RNA polymerase sigma factor [Marinobacter manganoxydans]EHJ06236.1 ECF subfamily RNA polymerase sigma-24 factor [Marinobacter manganoxydans MnI7-9]